jgi:subtilase family serine protease
MNAAYSAGYTGIGQSIAVVGQSAVLTSDVTNFQTNANVPVRPPNLVLMPGTGVSQRYAGDESESDLDLEYTSAIAKNATIYFVYTGSSPNYGAFDAMVYAITNAIAPIVSVSYGTCEIALGSTKFTEFNNFLQQAAAQGQTVIAAAGDQGSTDCYNDTGLTSAIRAGVAVDFPAASPYVTGMGGTEYTKDSVSSTNTQYWNSASGSDVTTSAKSYIPEQAWNDDSTTGGSISSGGGGISTFASRPGWQVGVAGIPTGTYRLVPDISLASSPNNAGYLYCSSDSSTGVTGSCSHGFRDVNTSTLTVAGGTSFASPIFAGMLAIINQKTNSTSGQGLINPTLYTLAANPTIYASAFHDTTTGTNACTTSTTYKVATATGPACAAGGSYATTTGYDLATGLGSIDLFNLLSAWPVSVSNVQLKPATLAPVSGANDVVTITVTASTTSLPTGTVTISVDGSAASAPITLMAGGSGATANYTFTSTATGQHSIKAVYSGDGSHPAATAYTAVTVAAPGGFTLSATAVTAISGSSGVSTVTVTPTGGFTGTVTLGATTSTTIDNACYSTGAATVTAPLPAPAPSPGPFTGILTIYTDSTNCPNAALPLLRSGGKQASATPLPLPVRRVPIGIAIAGLLAMGFVGRRSKKLRGVVLAVLLGVAGFGMSGCGSTAASTAPTIPPVSTLAAKGTYNVTVTGVDNLTGTTTASTTFTLTIQ